MNAYKELVMLACLSPPLLLSSLMGMAVHAASRPAAQADGAFPARHAFQLRWAGRNDAARTVLNQALATQPSDGVLRFESARLHFATFDFDQAAGEIGKAIQSDVDNPRYHFWAGQIATFQAVLKAHQILGGLSAAFEVEEAKRSYERALRLKKDDHEARVALVNLHSRGPIFNDWEARRHIKILDSMDPVWAAKARSTLRAQTPQQLVDLWTPVVANHANRTDAHIGLGDALHKAGKHEQALAEYQQAMVLDPQSPGLLLKIASCHRALRRYDQQAACYGTYLEWQPPCPQRMRAHAMRQLADAEQRRGRTAQAESLRAEADRTDPRSGRGDVPGDVPDLFTEP